MAGFFGGQAADGMRAQRLAKERELGRDEQAFQKKKLADSMKVSNIESKFASTYDAVEQEIKASTVGLVTIDQMKQTQVSSLSVLINRTLKCGQKIFHTLLYFLTTIFSSPIKEMNPKNKINMSSVAGKG